MREKAWKERTCELLSAQAVRRRGWFSPDYVQTLLRRFYSGASYRRDRSLGNVTSVGLLIWSLIALESWARQHLDAE
jgi:hypothetical protein